MPIIHAAVIQAEVAPDLATGLEQTADLARDAKAARADLVVFPETWLPGYPAWLDICCDVALWNHAPVKAVFARMAANSVVIAGGSGRGTLYNALLTYGPDGTLLNHHRKLMPTYTERLVWGTGDADGLRAVATPAGRVGGLVCWEHWMPLARPSSDPTGRISRARFTTPRASSTPSWTRRVFARRA